MRPRPRTVRRVAVLATLAAVLAGVMLLARPMAAHADANVDEAQFFASLNALRARLGLKPLLTDGQLINVARVWSSKMAGDGALSHNPSLASQVSDWRTLGENVGTGTTVAGIEAALEASPHHYENMTDPNFNYVGIGVVEAGGAIWVTQDFKQSKSGVPSTATPNPAPAPKSSPTPAPGPSAGTRPRPSAGAPVARTSRSSAAAPAAGAAASPPAPTGGDAAAAPAPDSPPHSGPEPATSGASVLPARLSAVPASGVFDGPRLASLALFGILAAIAVLIARGKLDLSALRR